MHNLCPVANHVACLRPNFAARLTSALWGSVCALPRHKSFPGAGGVPLVPEASLGSFKGKQRRGNHYITRPFSQHGGDELIKCEIGSRETFDAFPGN